MKRDTRGFYSNLMFQKRNTRNLGNNSVFFLAQRWEKISTEKDDTIVVVQNIVGQRWDTGVLYIRMGTSLTTTL